jgi:hypothetical protein
MKHVSVHSPGEPAEAAPADRPGGSRRRALADAEHAFGADFRRRQPVVWLVTLVGPPLATLAILAALWLSRGPEFVQRLLMTAVATFFLFGRFVILGGRVGGGSDPELAEVQRFFSREELFGLVCWMDLVTAVLLVYHAGFLFRIPFFGPRMLALVDDGQFILDRHPWMRRATFVGLVAFVTMPLAATGSVGGSIFGRLLGLSRRATLTAIMLGSVIGGGITYFFADLIARISPQRTDPVFTVLGIGLIAAVLLLLNWRYRSLKSRHQPQP